VTTGTAEIDGRAVPVREGDTILSAARRAGIEIPALCAVEGLAPEGGCRLCLVEVAGAPRPSAACHAPIVAGLRVRTATPALERLRREILELLAEARPFRANPRGGEFAALLARHGVAAPASAPARVDATHPYLRFDPSLCIVCRRCVHACDEIQGQRVYDVAGRGAATSLLYGPTERFAESDCTACGACVDLCPTGALFDRDREDGPEAEASVASVCGYCGVGCRVGIETRAGRVLRIRGVPDAAVNRGHLCAKGRFAHAWQRSPERLTTPLVREGPVDDPRWRAIGWDEALGLAARRLGEIRARHGPDALGAMSSSRSTNEAAYLLQKLFRAVLGTNNVDCCARVCHSSTALALGTVTGTGAASASYADVERAARIVVAGANPTEAHPVVGARIRQAVLRGARLVVIDPRRIELVELADVHLAVRPGANVALANALAKLLLERGRVDAAYLAERVEGLEALREFLGGLELEALAAQADVPLARIEAAAEIVGAGPTLFVTGLGLSELAQGTASVMALANLAMLGGSIGRPGAGMLPLRGQNNVQGNADMGSMPDLATGYQRLDDPDVRARLARLWGAAPPERPGRTIPEMLEAAVRREIRALWIQGEDPAQSDPHQSFVLEALAALDFLVVQELFPSETARYAHLLLPAAGALEQDGTFTNGERRIQRVRTAVPAPGLARPDWEVIRDAARAFGAEWSYADPAHVMDEIAEVAPRLFGGVRYPRLDPDGLQWPCPHPGHLGTGTVHAEGFLRGRGCLVALDYAPSSEHDVDGYPYLLVTGRVLHHYNVGTMTRRTPQRDLVGEDALEIGPGDARREGIADGAFVRLESRWGAIRVRARHSPRVAPGTLFLSFHYPETHANRVTGPERDPRSKCPQYKATAVRLRGEGGAG
jgi:formate dehydrogenase alpha subunit